ncbi:PepSY-associated TM helix domain-containing protein [Methylolobus aquaticus]
MLLHRYVGLSLALFLIVSGATGAAIAFQDELDEWLNADWFRTGRSDPALPPQQLIQALERADGRLRVQYLPVGLAPGRAARVMVEPRAEGDVEVPAALEFDEMFVDPANGQVLGTRRWGDCCLDRRKLMPFLYELHHRLLLPGEWGRLLLGSVALLWMLDCVVGLYLTFPRASRKPVAGPAASLPAAAPAWWRRWLAAWSIKRGSSWTRLNWDLHRAGGLWFWGVLLALACSGVSLNLGDEIVEPALSAFSDLTPSPFDAREDALAEQPVEPKLSFDDALTQAQAEALRAGWTASVGGVFYNAAYGIYGVHFGRDKDIGWGARYIYLDGVDGSLLGRHEPGTGTGADRFMDLQLPLHSGRILGTAGRALIAVSGIAVVILTVTGIVIWSRKRRVRSHRTVRPPGAPAGE